MSGAIEFADSAVNCIVGDISIGGAALEVSSPSDIPDKFTLVFKADQEVNQAA